MEAVRFDLKDERVVRVVVVGIRVAGKVSGVSSAINVGAAALGRGGGERGSSEPLTGSFWGCLFSLRICFLTCDEGVRGLNERGDSRSDSSKEGMESVESDRYEDNGATVLPLATLHASPSLSLFSPTSSGGPWRMLQDFGLELDSVYRKSSRLRFSFLMFLPDKSRRRVKPGGFWLEATANSAAIDGGSAFGS